MVGAFGQDVQRHVDMTPDPRRGLGTRAVAVVSTSSDGVHYFSRESGGCALGPHILWELGGGATTSTGVSTGASASTAGSGHTGSGAGSGSGAGAGGGSGSTGAGGGGASGNDSGCGCRGAGGEAGAWGP